MLSAKDTENLLKALGQADATMLSAPRISTVNGVQARVQIGPGKPQEGKTSLTTALDITPSLSDDRSSMDVDVKAQQTPQNNLATDTNTVENANPSHLSRASPGKP